MHDSRTTSLTAGARFDASGFGAIDFPMPTYVYEVIDEQGEGTGEYFEVIQPITDDALKKHPESGKPVRRVPQAFNIAGKWSDMKSKSMLSNKNLENLGFTKYEKRGDGYMERVAGKEGPRSISTD